MTGNLAPIVAPLEERSVGMERIVEVRKAGNVYDLFSAQKNFSAIKKFAPLRMTT